jgi:hypothetical protein
MNTAKNTTEDLLSREYKYGFVTDIEADTVPRGLNKEIVRLISAEENGPNFMLDWRLKAYRQAASARVFFKSCPRPSYSSPMLKPPRSKQPASRAHAAAVKEVFDGRPVAQEISKFF